jgi:hypothetical protein
MSFIRFILAVGLTVSITTPSFSGCDEVYTNNVRNRTFTEDNYASLNTVYDNLCSSSGSKKSLSWDSSMGIIIDSLPINMTGNGKSTEEKADAFCHTYHSLRFDTSHNAVAKDEVVSAALGNYNTCKEIEARTGVVVTHKFADPDSLVVNFDFKNPNTFLRIDGVLATNMICQSNAAPEGEKSLNQNSHFEMRSNFAITCGRVHPKGDDSTYIPGSLAIGTSVTSYVISLPADSIYNNSLASDATSKINDLQKSLSSAQNDNVSLSTRLSNANKKIDGIKISPHRIMIGQYNPGGGFEFHGCGTDLNQVRDSLCKGSVQSSITQGNSVSGHQCGYTDFVIACLYLGQ